MTYHYHTNPYIDAASIRARWAAHKHEVAATGGICAWLGVASHDPSDVADNYSLQDRANGRG